MNVDYAVASTLADDIKGGIKDVVITYDIGCQWGKNLSLRLSNTPSLPSLDIKALDTIRFAVPKFHINTHGASCQANFNLAYMDGVGMTHGETVETIWSHSTSLAVWSRENGPAARHTILDNHWGGWNWRKFVGLRKASSSFLLRSSINDYSGVQLKKMLKRAIEWAKTQRKQAKAMTDAWPNLAPSWQATLRAYKRDQLKPKRDRSVPNPFEEPDCGMYACRCPYMFELNNFNRYYLGKAKGPAREGGSGAAKGRCGLPS